jgi:hypothetical protein
VINEPEAEMPADPQNLVVVPPPPVSEWIFELARRVNYEGPMNSNIANTFEVFR